MALNLDTRQRAMLQDMGITVWLPKAAAPAVPETAAVVPPAQRPAAVDQGGHAPVSAPAVPAARAASSPASSPAPVPAALAAPGPVAADWRMAPPVQAYPQAAGGSADDGWLVVWEGVHPQQPLAGDSGKLLNNMLRALRLHHSPHVWIACVQRPGHEALPMVGLPVQPANWQPLAQALPASLRAARPARVLVLGLHLARAILGRQEALGRLRAQVHQLHGVPAVVSYDPAYLLRSPHAKPAAWADLCRAHALRPPPAG